MELHITFTERDVPVRKITQELPFRDLPVGEDHIPSARRQVVGHRSRDEHRTSPPRCHRQKSERGDQDPDLEDSLAGARQEPFEPYPVRGEFIQHGIVDHRLVFVLLVPLDEGIQEDPEQVKDRQVAVVQIVGQFVVSDDMLPRVPDAEYEHDH